MAFLSDLLESFVPTLAFAENEESTTKVESAVEETTSTEPENDTAAANTPAPGFEESRQPEPEQPKSTETEEKEQEELKNEESTPETPAESTEESTEESSEPETPAEEDEEEDDEEEDEEDDEEEEEGAGDPLDALRAECAEKAEIKPYVHHYAECVERVTKAQEQPGYEDLEYKEDCIEEFFHLQHHINDCVAPRLFYKLK
ncbi:hypothetical protein WICMUC_002052 [Wickerhamomyces mucosus]|uniref:Cytochrome b-c1 complex subunit 6, mitochondrial n=1 Tax=Wickerhamomyces mucosus TaxID=1378264 RepID=A0A9P8PQL2_9ASCO|nr:hypothetical protein WICMUC_002052 [Wickerhamomyces mucosus]